MFGFPDTHWQDFWEIVSSESRVFLRGAFGLLASNGTTEGTTVTEEFPFSEFRGSIQGSCAAAVILCPIILAPFQNVTVHVEQPPGVGSVTSDRNGSFLSANRESCLFRGQLVTKGEASRGSGAAGVFPLRFGW